MSKIDFVGVICLVGVIMVAMVPAFAIVPAFVSGGGAAQAAPIAACVPPTHEASTAEETAWRLFVAAACPVNRNKYP